MANTKVKVSKRCFITLITSSVSIITTNIDVVTSSSNIIIIVIVIFTNILVMSIITRFSYNNFIIFRK